MFQRKPIREDLHTEILARIGDGRLPAGARINESHLSADLGVSRTPLREAMLGLEARGFLSSDMGRGFLVPDMRVEEFVEIQGVLAHLKPLALGLALPAPPNRVMELQNVLQRAKLRNREKLAEQAAALADLEFRWTHLLLGACPNRTLSEDILRLDGLARRYWREAVLRGFDCSGVFESLGAIYELVRTDQREAAAGRWGEHIVEFGREAARHLPAADAG